MARQCWRNNRLPENINSNIGIINIAMPNIYLLYCCSHGIPFDKKYIRLVLPHHD